MENIKSLFAGINTFIFDMDGVITDGNVFAFPNGEHVRMMNVKDGYAMQLAIKKGYRIVIISGGVSEAMIKRFEYLGITEVYFGIKDKINFFNDYIKKNNLSPSSILYMGDDIPDYEIMKVVKLPCCPADAVEEIKQISVYVSKSKGGEGCVRDVIENVLKLDNNWFDDKHSFIW